MIGPPPKQGSKPDKTEEQKETTEQESAKSDKPTAGKSAEDSNESEAKASSAEQPQATSWTCPKCGADNKDDGDELLHQAKQGFYDRPPTPQWATRGADSAKLRVAQ